LARANRINGDKNNGLIIDYCGILKNLRKALATFTGTGDTSRTGGLGPGELDPTRTKEELLEELKQAIGLVSDFLSERKASLDIIINTSGFERNKAIVAAKEAVNENDETRKKFEVMCREVFIKFKACLTISGVNTYRNQYNAINIIYKSLQKDIEQADISDIIKQLHEIIDESITVTQGKAKEPNKSYDISKINFKKLHAEFVHDFKKSKEKNTIVQSLKSVIEKKLEQLIQRNPLRTDFQEHYEKIIDEYNKEKDRQNIEATFEALLKFVQELDEEESRAVREGLDEETLAIYDLLVKPDLKPQEIQKIKKVAQGLLKTLKGKLKDMYKFQDKEPTRDAVKVLIRNFLWDEKTGLPVENYSQNDVYKKAEAVFYHVFRAYPTVPSPYYASVAN